MKPERLFTLLDKAWVALLESFQGIPDNDQLKAGAVGYWSIRDVMAHITSWEEETMKTLPLILEDKPVPRYVQFGGIDAFNAMEQERKRGLTLAEVRYQLVTTHARLIHYLRDAPSKAFDSDRFIRRLRQDTYGHYREHISQVLGWRAQQGL